MVPLIVQLLVGIRDTCFRHANSVFPDIATNCTLKAYWDLDDLVNEEASNGFPAPNWESE